MTKIFDTHAVSSNVLKSTLKGINKAIQEKAEHSQIPLATAQNIVYDQMVQADDRKRSLNYELPYGKWF